MSESKCPVCGWKLEAGATKIHVEGRDVAVCCDDCAAQLKAAPRKFLGVGGLA
jgi:hypothetical protein